MSEDMNPSAGQVDPELEGTKVAEPEPKQTNNEEGKVDPVRRQEQINDETVPQWKYNRLYRRQKKTEETLEASMKQIAEYKTTLEEFRARPVQTSQDPNQDYFANPADATARIVAAEMDKRFQKFENRFDAKQRSDTHERSVNEALDYVRSQKDVTSQKELMEIADVMDEYGLDGLARTDPIGAAEKALKNWRQEKGITNNSLKKRQAVSVKGTPAMQSSGWTLEKINKLAKDNPDEYAKREDEIMAALNSGRVTQ